MSKSLLKQSSTNNQSIERLGQETPLQPKPDNTRGALFLHKSKYYTLETLTTKLFK